LKGRYRHSNHGQGQTVKKAVVVFFAALLLLVNTPMDFIHLFTGHKDGVHQKHNGLVIEQHHHHCGFLQLTVTPFANDTHFPVLQFAASEYGEQHFRLCDHIISSGLFHHQLRGPPAA
jgi:hypothetical protein